MEAVIFRIELSGVIYPEDGWWLAHCLQLDIVAEGKTPEEAFENLQGLCDLQLTTAIEEGDIQSVLRPAPPEIWRMFFMARDAGMAAHPDIQATPLRKAPVTRFDVRQLAYV